MKAGGIMLDLEQELHVDLELWLLEDELRCEMGHQDSTCSIEVTHAAIDCKRARNICFNAAQNIVERMGAGVTCVHCSAFAKDCWRVVPI